MVPRRIIERARTRRLDIVGICDHNSAENVMVMQKVGDGEGVAVIGGIEATSEEEVHILALFDDAKSLFEFQSLIYEGLPGLNDERRLGNQLVVDERDEVTDRNDRLLIGASSLSVQEIVEATSAREGLAVASHIDRESFSIISQLGFVPEGLALDALELSPGCECGAGPGRPMKEPGEYGFPLVTFSDAHVLEDIGKRVTTFVMEEPTTVEIRRALSCEGGRKVLLH